jgi:transposase
MHDRELYRQILGIEAPWTVSAIEVDLKGEGVTVHVEHTAAGMACPECGAVCPAYDARQRKWRHLDTCQYATWLIAQVPRVNCPQHGVRQIKVPWAESDSRLTALFEALVIDWLKVATIAEVARRLRLSWAVVAGVQARAVTRGLARRAMQQPTSISIDETSFAKRHEYVTVISTEKRVLHVADGRSQAALEGWYSQQARRTLEALRTVAMDMWAPYIQATRAWVPDAEHKIAFDRFHVAQHLNFAVDQVRRREHRALTAAGDDALTRTRFLWLQNPRHMSRGRRDALAQLRQANLKTGRAWAIKEQAACLWGYRTRGWARRAWMRWYQWAIRSRLEPIKRAARLVKKHLEGIITAVVTQATTARAEGFNAMIQKIKSDARGFRNRDRFRAAIYFHLGGLDLYPESLRA